VLIRSVVIVDDVEEMNSLEFMGENVPARMLALQHSSQYLKEVIKSVKLVVQIAHT
jgi:hypothetical protein